MGPENKRNKGTSALLLVSLGGLLSLLLAVDRFTRGLHPGLALIAAGILIPLVIACHRWDYFCLLDKLKTHVTQNQLLALTRPIIIFFVYLGGLGALAYELWSYPVYFIIWLFLVTPLGSLLVAKSLKSYI